MCVAVCVCVCVAVCVGVCVLELARTHPQTLEHKHIRKQIPQTRISVRTTLLILMTPLVPPPLYIYLHPLGVSSCPGWWVCLSVSTCVCVCVCVCLYVCVSVSTCVCVFGISLSQLFVCGRLLCVCVFRFFPSLGQKCFVPTNNQNSFI